MAKFLHLDETHQEAIERTCTRQWNTMFLVQQNHKLRLSLWGTQFFGFQKAERNTLKDSKNNGLVHEKYSIVSPIILRYLATLTSLNQIHFGEHQQVQTLQIFGKSFLRTGSYHQRGRRAHKEDLENNNKEDS